MQCASIFVPERVVSDFVLQVKDIHVSLNCCFADFPIARYPLNFHLIEVQRDNLYNVSPINR